MEKETISGDTRGKHLRIKTGRTWYQAPPILALRDILTRGDRLYGNRTAVRWRLKPDSKTIESRTYRQMFEDVAAVQRWLLNRLPRGSRIALIGENSYPWMTAWLAAASGFGVIVPIDRLLKAHEIEPILQRSGASMIIYDASWHDVFSEMKGRLPALKWRAVMDRGTLNEETRDALRKDAEKEQDLLFFDDALISFSSEAFSREDTQDGSDRNQEEALLDISSPDDDAAILFTSGTSATSKAVILTNRSITADIRALLGSVSFPDPLQTLSILPLHHAFENTCGFLTVLSLGGTIHVFDGLRYIGRNLEEYHPHLTIVVPAILDAVRRKILKEAQKTGQLRKLKAGMRLSTMLFKMGIDRRRALFHDVLEKLGGNLQFVICGAAPASKETLYFFRAIGVEVLAGYGLTEASPVVSGGNTKVNVFGTTGEPLSGVEVAIDDDGSGRGEILVRSEILMKGYLDDPEATAETIDSEGWLHTADVGHWSRRGSLVITGRSKSMIVLSNGKKIFPEEIEAILNRDDMIRDALVFGHESPSGDVVLTAILVLDKKVLTDLLNREPTEDDYFLAAETLIDRVNRGLPAFKGIRSYVYGFQDMVKTTTLKVCRHIEMAKIDKFIRSSKASWQQLRGKNIDVLMEQEASKK